MPLPGIPRLPRALAAHAEGLIRAQAAQLAAQSCDQLVSLVGSDWENRLCGQPPGQPFGQPLAWLVGRLGAQRLSIVKCLAIRVVVHALANVNYLTAM